MLKEWQMVGGESARLIVDHRHRRESAEYGAGPLNSPSLPQITTMFIDDNSYNTKIRIRTKA
jgi:hypothetical protein